MEIEKYSFGGTLPKAQPFQILSEVPQNRVLLVERLTDDQKKQPEIIQGLENLAAVFARYAPAKEIVFKNETGGTCRETLRFMHLHDFGVQGISRHSKFLNDLNFKTDQYQKIKRELRTNNRLRNVLSDSDGRRSLITTFRQLLAEVGKD